MTPELRKLAARMLRDYARDLGNRGCNDFDMKTAGIPEAQWEEVARQAAVDNRSPDEHTPGLPPDAYRHTLADFQVASMLASMLEKDVGEG